MTSSTLPQTMQAWQKHFTTPPTTTPQRVTLPIPTPAPDSLLIRILAAGVCHSDIALLSAPTAAPYMSTKYTLGHEGCGSIESIGSDVDRSKLGLREGDVVAINAVAGCQRQGCGECGRGLSMICQAGEHYGIGNDGSYAEFVCVKWWAVAGVPSGVKSEVGAVATDACMTAYHAVVGTGKVEEGETVVIIGLGGLGFNAMQIAITRGARVVVVDTREDTLEEAVRFGVKRVDVVPVGKGLFEFVKENKLVVDTVVDFVGVPETCSAAQQAVRFGGKYVLVGLLSPEVKLDTVLVVRKHLQILCSYGGAMDDLKACLDLIAKGQLKPQVVTADMDKLDEVLDDLHQGKIKSRIALVPKQSSEKDTADLSGPSARQLRL